MNRFFPALFLLAAAPASALADDRASAIPVEAAGAVPTAAGSGAVLPTTNDHGRPDRLVRAGTPAAARGKAREAAARRAPGVARGAPGVEQVIVTAQKRAERLQDVPVAVTVLSSQALLQNNQTQLADYFARIPGVDFASNVRGAPLIAIRGLSTGTDLINPTVGIVIDDVPLGASTGLAGGDTTPDLDPNDLQRVEVLRGPQGTLYGASSLGGLIKFVTVEPSTTRVSGSVQAGAEGVRNGSGPGYNLRGLVNVPLSDSLAVLVSAFTHDDPGYIDNPSHGLSGVNALHSSGGRLAVLWRPSDDFSVKLSALDQETRTDGADHVEIAPGVSGLQQTDIPHTGSFAKNLQAYSATVNARLGGVQLTSITGYTLDHIRDSIDYSSGFSFLGGATEAGLGIPDGTTGSVLDDDNATDRLTQEVRLAVPLGRHFDWLLGGFYTNEISPSLQTVFAASPATGAYLGQWASLQWATTYRELAGFSDLTWHVTDRLDVQGGFRESSIRQTYHETDSGPLVPLFEGFASPLVFRPVVLNSSAFTYLVTPRFRITPDTMVYARFSSGYRPGGPNPTASAFGLPLVFQPDEAKSYELGYKGSFLDHRVTIDASLYYIDWKNIQLAFIDPANGFAFNANGSRARSDGIEVSTALRPLDGLTVQGAMAYDDAVLTASLPPSSSVYGASGDRLPFSPRFSASATVREEVPLTGRIEGFASATLSYVGDREGNFNSAPPSPPPRQIYPDYARVDVQAGVTMDAWTASLFINNVADRRGILYGGLGTLPNIAEFQYIQPRTIGLTVVRKF